MVVEEVEVAEVVRGSRASTKAHHRKAAVLKEGGAQAVTKATVGVEESLAATVVAA